MAILDLNYDKLFNIYEELDIKLTNEIIRQISNLGDITSYSEAQLRTLVELNGQDIFFKALDETSLITSDMKNKLKSLYQEYGEETVRGYKQEYKYRGRSLKLNATQLNILNYFLETTGNSLTNMTNTIAFATEQNYVNAVDKAILEVATGGIDYNKAIYNTYKDLANKGVTLQDSLGRDVQLDVAVRRNVLGGIQQMTNSLNENIFSDLGCNGYEVTAHSGARPTHAVAQGKQYALTQEDANKYNVGYWYDTVDGEPIAELWNDYNCRHSYNGVILGVSDPQYSKKELKSMEDETVDYNGEKMSLYEATQRQRYYERNIRARKKAIKSLDGVKDKNVLEAQKNIEKQLKNYRRKYREFNRATGLEPDYSRTRI